jgi:hypothetical protein
MVEQLEPPEQAEKDPGTDPLVEAGEEQEPDYESEREAEEDVLEDERG